MKDNGIVVRKADVADLTKLKDFFIKAYGSQTIFQDEGFLLYYFGGTDKKSRPLNYSLIGISSSGEIVSHYGGLRYGLKLNEQEFSVVWGVNAFTLPKWRGKGINSKIVDYIHENNEANAVIGMPFDAPFFYEKLGYNIFNKGTLNRFIYVLDSKTLDIVKLINQDLEKAKKIIKLEKPRSINVNSEKMVKLTKDNFKDYTYDLKTDVVATTNRDKGFLSWRLFNNPYIDYKVYGLLHDNKIITYVAIREEILEPTEFKVTRIIDLFGKRNGIIELLQHTILNAISTDSVYIDFSMYGKLYELEIMSLGFRKLENDEVAILPMVSSPIENRPNHEFIVLQSKLYNDEIQKLTVEDVYFTRIDGDRDRIARITQLKGDHEQRK